MPSDAAEALVDVYCRQLKLPGLRQNHRAIARESLNQGQSPAAFLAACLAQEVEARRARRLQTRLRQARFPAVKTFDTFDFTAVPQLPKPKVLNLAEGGFVKARESMICLGPSGTGKTHTAIALGLGAIQAGYRVRFVTAIQLTSRAACSPAGISPPALPEELAKGRPGHCG